MVNGILIQNLPVNLITTQEKYYRKQIIDPVEEMGIVHIVLKMEISNQNLN